MQYWGSNPGLNGKEARTLTAELNPHSPCQLLILNSEKTSRGVDQEVLSDPNVYTDGL